MTEYINPPFDIDPSTLEQEMMDYLLSVFPSLELRDPHVIKIVNEAYAAAVSELMTLATDVPATIFRYFGRLVGINPDDGNEATGNLTVTSIDTNGPYTIPDSTGFRIPFGSDFRLFTTVGDVTIPNGSSTTAVGGVVIRAIDIGEDYNSLGPGVQLTDVLDFVNTVTNVGTTTGGSSQETDEEYLGRLSARLTLLADHPVTPDDFVTYTNSVEGVTRSLALDGYNPTNDTFNNDKMITMAAVDAAGNAVSPTVKTNILALLTAAREVNFDPRVIDPTYTVVNIVCSVKALPGYDLTDLDTRVTAAVLAYVSPIEWGVSLTGDQTSWVFEDKVRFTNVVAEIENVAGVNYIVSGTLTINGVAGDLTLSGRAPMPSVSSTANITVVAP